MAAQEQVVLEVEGREVDLVLGDLFDSDASILVVPCSLTGGVSRDFGRGLERLGISPLTDALAPGEIVLAGRGPDSGKEVYLAAIVTSPATVEDDVRLAAGRIGQVVARSGGSAAFPLLGAGERGNLAPATSLRAIATGFGKYPGKVQVYVREPAVFTRLAESAKAAPPTSRARRAATPSGSSTTTSPPPSSSTTPPPDSSSTTSPRGFPSPAEPPDSSSTAAPPDSSSVDASADPSTGSPTAAPSVSSADPATAASGGSAVEADSLEQQAVPTHADGPAYFDELGREGFALVLAQRIRDARKEETKNSSRAHDSRSPRGGAFILHLHAPWGAGKTSVLNFLAAELRQPTDEDEKRCVVVEFNAWRHQRIVPPWWWLMTALYSGAVRELWRRDKPRAAYLWFRERLWRSKAGWPGYVALLFVVGALVLAWQTGWFDALGKEKLFEPDTAKGYLAAAAAIITPALTIWGLLHAMGRWVFTTSARGARRFMANTSDPMRTVQDHVDQLTRWIHHDVVVMIDDLDRCKGPYVVELLEGIQTLFRDVPVTYVIAADRDWLADSYAAEYSGFVSAGGDAGRPVGYLFLEKTFQISTGLPRSGEWLSTYWNRLLQSSSVPDPEALKKARADSSEALKGKSGKALRDEVIAHPGNTPAEVQARLESVAVEMVTERAQQQFKHTLAPFRDLLGRDQNPRAMKRLVNAYGIARGIETLHSLNLSFEHLHEQETALWTLLMLRWPKLAGHLARYPEHLQYIGTPNPPATTPDSAATTPTPATAPSDPATPTPTELPAAIPADLRPLFADPEVVAVVQGKGVDASLTPEFLERSPLR